MKIDQETIFIVAAESENFSSAAKVLGITPAAVGKQIQQLEQTYSTQLFIRNTRSVRLSRSGEMLLQHFQEIRDIRKKIQLDLEEVENGVNGEITITSPLIFAHTTLLELIREFRMEHPGITFRILSEKESLNIVSRPVDVAFKFGELDDSDLVARELIRSPLIVCCSPEYAERLMGVSSIPDLKDVELIVLEDSHIVSMLENKFLERLNIRSNVSIRSNDTNVILYSMINGLGLSILPYHSVHEYIERGQLVQVIRNLPLPTYPFSIVYNRSNRLPKIVRTFIEFICSSAHNMRGLNPVVTDEF